jgi:uncharacterized protein (DUF1800 family)
MRTTRLLLPLALLGLAGCSAGGPAGSPAASGGAASRLAPSLNIPSTGWPVEKQALHALNRLAFGPAPGDVDAVARMGVARWIGAQMAPASLPDGAVEAKLRNLPTLTMTIAQAQEAFPRPQAVAGQAFLAKDDPERKEKAPALIDPEKRPLVLGRELAVQKVVRAVESTRQLQEVLTDFWFNHFNVFAGKGEDRWMVTSYERDAIRPNVLGTFRGLLEATGTHPAMLFYLDNWSSTKDGMVPRKLGLNENYARELLELHTLGVDGGYTQQDVREVARCFTGWSIVQPRGPQQAMRRSPAGERGTFVYRDAAHDKGAKVVLGTAISAGGGREDGERVLDLLARHPSTARFVATKLCRKFVRDDPPPALVSRIANVFLNTGGDLRPVYAALFSSPEFWSDAAFGAKTKTPLELAVSAVRAVGGAVRVDPPPALVQQIGRMGEPLYECQPPTGYKETADAWVNTGALLARLNFGIALASGRVPGVEADFKKLLGDMPGKDPAAAVDHMGRFFLHEAPSPATRQTILDALATDTPLDPMDGARRGVDVVRIAGLLLGSPEFQKQ